MPAFRAIDEHCRIAPFSRNLPVLMGLVAIRYNRDRAALDQYVSPRLPALDQYVSPRLSPPVDDRQQWQTRLIGCQPDLLG
jgi:hypothetical protein